jgi:hypothetical protein
MNRILPIIACLVIVAVWPVAPARAADSPGGSGKSAADKPSSDKPSTDSHAGESRGNGSAKPADHPDDRGGTPSRGEARPTPPPTPPAPPPVPKDQKDFIQYMKDHAPNVLRVLAALPANPARRGLAADFVSQSKQLTSIKNDQDLTTILTKRFSLQDAICRDMIDLAHAQVDSPPATKAEKDLRDDVASLVNNTIDEREHRIMKLTDLINGETDAVVNENKALQSAPLSPALAEQHQRRIKNLTDLIKQEQDVVASQTKSLQSDQLSLKTIVQDRVNAYNARAHLLGNVPSTLPADRTLLGLFFDDTTHNPSNPTPAGH